MNLQREILAFTRMTLLILVTLFIGVIFFMNFQTWEMTTASYSVIDKCSQSATMNDCFAEGITYSIIGERPNILTFILIEGGLILIDIIIILIYFTRFTKIKGVIKCLKK